MTAPPEHQPSLPATDMGMLDQADRDERVRTDLSRLLQARLLRESGLVLFGHPLLIALIGFLVWDQTAHAVVLGWGLAVVLATAFRAGWLRTVTRRRVSEREIWQGVRLTVVLLGITWGVGAAVLLQDVPSADAALVLVVLAGISAGAVTTLAADLPSFYGFLGAIVLPLCAGVLASGHDRPHLVTVAMVVLFPVVLGLIARRAHDIIVDHLQVTTRLAVSEEAAKRAADVMREARDLAERSGRARSAFLANMSHEIRTPMNAILGFVELILDTDLTTEQRRSLELVRSSSDALLTILNDILDYSKIEADHLDLESIAFDLSKVVHATASLLSLRAREKDVELLAEVPSDVPRVVRGDPTRLRQVLMNLIGNAIKFTAQGEVVVAVAAAGTENGRARAVQRP